jgi:6-phospho-beta-glucosidase
MQGLKVVTIGGGSSYTPELVEGLLKRQEELPVRELWLVDIEPGKQKLEIIGNLAERMVKKAGAPLKVHTTLNRRDALQNADFVTTQIRVGLLDARIKDERIPLTHGYIGQETNGAGGMFKALRTIPVMLDISKDLAELCPDAWMINFTNPSGINTEAMLRYGKHQKNIGLCNLPIGMEKAIAGLCGVDPGRIRIDFAGLNHMVFGLNVYLDGDNIMRQIIKKIGNGEMRSMLKNFSDFEWSAEFIEGLGVIPCSYSKYYFQKQEMLEKELLKFSKGETRAEKVKKIEQELFELYQDPHLDVKPPQLLKRGGAYYSEAACRLMSSIYNDRKDIQVVNTRNNNAVTGLPAGSAVEVSCVITKDGPKPIAMGELPVAANGLVQQIKSFERLVVEAAVTGDYNTALVAMTINPLVQSEKMAKILLDELLEAHRDYLPQFKRHD